MSTDPPVTNWSIEDACQWLDSEGFSVAIQRELCQNQGVNGKCLLALTDGDFVRAPFDNFLLGERKMLQIAVKQLQRDNHGAMLEMGLTTVSVETATLHAAHHACHMSNMMYATAGAPIGAHCGSAVHYSNKLDLSEYCESECVSAPASEDGRHHSHGHARLPPDIGKAFLSFCYVVAVTWITAFVMVIVHDRVPDMKKYPPLPDIFLDNVPHIPWAFDMCEVTGTFLFTIWLIVLLFHKYRFILMRRFFALSGTVFLLRCVTMLITSLSVPGAHLQCQPRTYESSGAFTTDLAYKISQAYMIWRGAGMSIQGVRTCGDYMFSGHTVALTMLNFFITEYTPRHLYFLHTLTWIMNMFGVFFILAAHEHYSIDVFVAFYITSRLFLYYHTLSNNQALMQRDSTRTRIWFPLFSYFESSVEGIVPNEFETPAEILYNLVDAVRTMPEQVRPFVCAVMSYRLLSGVESTSPVGGGRTMNASTSPHSIANLSGENGSTRGNGNFMMRSTTASYDDSKKNK